MVCSATSTCRLILLKNFENNFEISKNFPNHSNTFPASFSLPSLSGTLIMNIFVYLLVSYNSLMLCFVFFLHFPFCPSSWISTMGLSSNSLILFSTISNLLLSPPSKHFSYFTFQLQNWYIYFKDFYAFINVIYLVRHSCHGLLLFFQIVSFSSLYIFIILNLKPAKSNIWTPSEIFFINCLFHISIFAWPLVR